MDQKGKGAFAGKTLLDLCDDSKSNVDAGVFARFYDSLSEKTPAHLGALPFRVWQMYDEMVASLKKGDVAAFVGAGVPCRITPETLPAVCTSRTFTTDRTRARPTSTRRTRRACSTATASISWPTFNAALASWTAKPTVKGGAEAAVEIVDVMPHVKTLPPQEVIDAFNDTDGDTKKIGSGCGRDRQVHRPWLPDARAALGSAWRGAPGKRSERQAKAIDTGKLRTSTRPRSS
jgi:hypothetical protein